MFRNPLTDSIVALAILVVIFGPKRLPGLGRSLGQGLRELRRSIRGRAAEEAGMRPALLPSTTSPPKQ
jgi:sec-independent protein translocase protein TatA